jgi:hypothetical protein
VNRDAAARLLPDLLAEVVEERRDLESFLAEPGVVSQGEPEITRPHDRDAQLLIQSENLAEMALEIANVVADAADAELAEVREVFTNLCGVEMELLGQRLGRDGSDAGAVEHVEAAQINRESIRGQFGDLIEALLVFQSLVRGFHKPRRL